MKSPYVFQPARGRQDKPQAAAPIAGEFKEPTVKQLKDLLTGNGIEFDAKAKKAELLELLHAADLADEAAEAK